MHNHTEQFFYTLEQLETKEQVREAILAEHTRLKQELKEKGFIILKDWENLKGGQIFSGEEEVALAHYYPEIHSMAQGVTTGWVMNIDRQKLIKELQTRLDAVMVEME